MSLQPKLSSFNTKRIQKKAGLLSNDQLFRSLLQAMEVHNDELIDYKEMTRGNATSEEEEKSRTDDMIRVALKQKLLECVVEQLDMISDVSQNRGIQKALLG